MRHIKISADAANYLIRADQLVVSDEWRGSLTNPMLQIFVNNRMDSLRRKGGEYCLRNGDKILATRFANNKIQWTIFTYAG
jgi:hypothetical protein